MIVQVFHNLQYMYFSYLKRRILLHINIQERIKKNFSVSNHWMEDANSWKMVYHKGQIFPHCFLFADTETNVYCTKWHNILLYRLFHCMNFPHLFSVSHQTEILYILDITRIFYTYMYSWSIAVFVIQKFRWNDKWYVRSSQSKSCWKREKTEIWMRCCKNMKSGCVPCKNVSEF